MQPESAKFLSDIAAAAARIGAYTKNKTLADYLATSELRDAVQWNFLIIGEALSQLAKFDPVTPEQITEYRRIIAFRNQLIHGYGVIKNDITWDIIQNKLPVLVTEVNRLLDS